MLSMPTPPRPIIFNFGQESIISFLILVALLTKTTSISLVFIKSIISSWLIDLVCVLKPDFISFFSPSSLIPSLINIFMYYILDSNSLITSTSNLTLSISMALYIEAL